MKWDSNLIPYKKLTQNGENSLAVQQLALGASTAGGPGSIPGRRTKIPQAVWHGQKKKKLKMD